MAPEDLGVCLRFRIQSDLQPAAPNNLRFEDCSFCFPEEALEQVGCGACA